MHIQYTHRQGLLTREQAVTETSEELIAKLESENCEPTNTSNSALEHAGIVEFSSSVSDGNTIVIAYYYVMQDELDAKSEDLSRINWQIEGFEIL